MSREIKFRAWDKETSKMHYQINKPRTDENIDDMLIIQFDCTGYSARTRNKYIGNNCLMQWTGLLDKNGKEVYGGDIIHFSKYNQKHNETDQGIGIVKFDEFDYTYCLRLEDCKQIKPKPSGFFRGLGDLGSCEIIGNIYENPELITGGKNG